jgi:hypothetical protein
LAFAIGADLFFVRIANHSAFATIFGIALGIDALILTDLLAIFAIEGAFAIFADLACFALCAAFAAVICCGFWVDALVTAIDLAIFAIGYALRALAFQHTLVTCVALLVIAGIGRYTR